MSEEEVVKLEEEVIAFLMTCGFTKWNDISVLNDDEDRGIVYRYMSEKNRSSKAQEYTHSVTFYPKTGRTIVWFFSRGTLFHGYIKSVEDLKTVFKLTKK